MAGDVQTKRVKLQAFKFPPFDIKTFKMSGQDCFYLTRGAKLLLLLVFWAGKKNFSVCLDVR